MKKIRLSAIEVSSAVDADDNMTVWNHVEKKYVAERLQTATRALLQPTRTGTFLSRKLAANWFYSDVDLDDDEENNGHAEYQQGHPNRRIRPLRD